MSDQSEIDRNWVLEQWMKSIRLNFQSAPREIESEGCQHEYADYIGFRETYRFCVKCDHKTPFDV